MEKTSYHNIYAVAIGVLMIITCCSIAYYYQKNLFNKYRKKVPNTVAKKPFDKL